VSASVRLLEWLNPQPGERFLDVGCGLGGLSASLASAGAIVTGIDPQAHLLEQARLVCPSGRFLAVGLLEFTAEAPFDGILAHAVLHWTGDPQSAFRKLWDLLRPGGRVAASFGARAAEAANLINYYLPDADECARALARTGFQSIRIEPWAMGVLVYAERPRRQYASETD
jgi:2-polyprenyl-3-methyl-5-hydroxy-6-metoxy-1,4-benzoquinol methylase